MAVQQAEYLTQQEPLPTAMEQLYTQISLRSAGARQGDGGQAEVEGVPATAPLYKRAQNPGLHWQAMAGLMLLRRGASPAKRGFLRQDIHDVHRLRRLMLRRSSSNGSSAASVPAQQEAPFLCLQSCLGSLQAECIAGKSCGEAARDLPVYALHRVAHQNC